jgi:hypothetical protein
MPPAKGVTNTFFQLLLGVGGRPFASQDLLMSLQSPHKACTWPVFGHWYLHSPRKLSSSSWFCFTFFYFLLNPFLLKVWEHPHSHLFFQHTSWLPIWSRKLCWAQLSVCVLGGAHEICQQDATPKKSEVRNSEREMKNKEPRVSRNRPCNLWRLQIRGSKLIGNYSYRLGWALERLGRE